MKKAQIYTLNPKNTPLLSKRVKVKFLGSPEQFERLTDRMWEFITGKDITHEESLEKGNN